jgi:hypothetical protein
MVTARHNLNIINNNSTESGFHMTIPKQDSQYQLRGRMHEGDEPYL